MFRRKKEPSLEEMFSQMKESYETLLKINLYARMIQESTREYIKQVNEMLGYSLAGAPPQSPAFSIDDIVKGVSERIIPVLEAKCEEIRYDIDSRYEAIDYRVRFLESVYTNAPAYSLGDFIMEKTHKIKHQITGKANEYVSFVKEKTSNTKAKIKEKITDGISYVKNIWHRTKKYAAVSASTALVTAGLMYGAMQPKHYGHAMEFAVPHTIEFADKKPSNVIEFPKKQVLEPVSYTVKKGDTLWGIAERRVGGASKDKEVLEECERLALLNGKGHLADYIAFNSKVKMDKKNPNLIYPGDRIILENAA